MTDAVEIDHEDAAPVSGPRMLLTFRLRGERFALDIDLVGEIIDPIDETPVPCASAFSPALINVRGSVVPLVEMRTRLGIPAVERPPEARFVVLDLPAGDEVDRIAVRVDAVDGVIETDPARLEKIPELGARWPPGYIRGVVRSGGNLVTLLDPDTLFDPTGSSMIAHQSPRQERPCA